MRSCTPQAQRTARALPARFEPGERVAIWAQNIPEWVMMEFGAAMAGVVLVTVNPAFRANELEYVLKQSRAAGVFVVTEFRGNPMLATCARSPPRCPELREIISLRRLGFLPRLRRRSPSIELPDVDPTDPVHDPVHVGHHGVSEGRAAAPPRPRQQRAAHRRAHAASTPATSSSTTMPLFHTGGCVCCVLGAVSRRGRRRCWCEAFEPGLVLELIETYRGNAMLGVPTMLVAMLEHPSFATADLSSVRAICSGGSTVPAALVTRARRTSSARAFTIVFGQTECSPVAAMTGPSDTHR